MTEARPGSAARPLGLFGGTFDPVHFGHLRLAEEACGALGLAGVRWMPAGQPPLRDVPGTAAADRLAMVRLAVADNPLFSVDAAEVDAAQPSYTVTTLERLRRELGASVPLVLLMGADAFLRLEGWHRWQSLFGLAHLGVATRPGHPLKVDASGTALAAEFGRRLGTAADLAAAPAGRIVPFAMRALDISATALRGYLATGESPRYLAPDAVLDYISRHRLYRPAGA